MEDMSERSGEVYNKERLRKIKNLTGQIEDQREMLRLRPFSDDENMAAVLSIATLYHELIWEGVPSRFNAQAPGNYQVLKSTRPPYTKASFPNYPPEIMLDDILKGLIFLDEVIRDEGGFEKRQNRWWIFGRRD